MDFKIENSTAADSMWEVKSLLDYVDDWPLMKSPLPVFAIWASYIIFVLKAGPDYMKNRTAFGLHRLLILYNLIQVIFSLYIVHRGLSLLHPIGYIHLSCNLDKETTMKQIASGIYIYFAAKLSELLDTIFFVLRKKQNQVSFLHVYHHSMMLWATWLTLKFEPTYSTIFLGTLNSFIHVVMYTYYGLSAFPSLSKYLWWKKYITSMQLLQFFIVIVHAVGNGIYSECPPSYILLSFITMNGFLLIYLFGNFYVQSYLKNRSDLNASKVTNSTKYSNGKSHLNGHKNGVVEANVADKKEL